MGALFSRRPPLEYVVFSPSVYEPETIEEFSQFIKTQERVITIAGQSTLVNFNDKYGQQVFGDKTKYFAHLKGQLFPNDPVSYVFVNTTLLGNSHQFVNLPCYLAYVKGKVHSFDFITNV
uniref:Uncharacterized protein n=1 Tax=Clandestinovirus TaxID=2831644 RepID=A0A8F8KSX7_9VIRU|nr:hypothetical protein KOM_12_226 [Clandestinovirus]